MTIAFESLYVGFFAGTLGLCGLGLYCAAGRPVTWSILAIRSVAAVGFVAVLVRWVEAGHLPLFGTFENTLTASASLLLAAVLTSRRRATTGSWAWAAPWALAMLLHGTRFRMEATPLTISEQSVWVDVHVFFAWIAFASLALASSMAVPRVLGRSFWGLEPDAADDRLSHALNLGFLSLTAMILVGAWYLYLLFAQFWRWDIVGTLCFLAWLGYGMVIHARLFYRLSGRGLAAAVLAVLPLLLLGFWIWSVFPGTYHYFDVPLLKPY